MDNDIAISVAGGVDEATRDAIVSGLDRYNTSHLGPQPAGLVWIVARAPGEGGAEGAVVGGIMGIALWNWFAIEIVWVDEAHRGTGLGTRLMRAAEEAAVEKGCANVELNTFTFQAPEFYRRLGYAEFGRLEDFPTGHTRIWMWKRLGAGAAAG